jgi:cytochrome c peroxidase
VYLTEDLSMSRKFWAAALPIICCAVVIGSDGPNRPSLPKDTLPEKLEIDSIPLGLDSNRPVPEDNPLTEAKVQLGRRLFFDPVLSVDRTVSCASCHDPAHGFAGRDRTSLGVRGQRGSRNAPSLLNIAFVKPLFWDGRAASLEEQALKPIESPQEMGNAVDEAVKRLASDAVYRQQFDAAFPDGVTAQNLARAIASFERTLLLGNTKPDAFKHEGDIAGMTDPEQHGMWLFESKARCWRCHSGRNFSDNEFHNTGVAWFNKSDANPTDLGRHAITKLDADRGKFKTPPLRGVALTAPYMHDGGLATLEDVVEFYNRGGGKNPNLDSVLTPLGLTPNEIHSLVAFLKALSEAAE